MNLKCLFVGHDWIIHRHFSNDGDNISGINILLIVPLVLLAIASLGILAPLCSSLYEHFSNTDKTCFRCDKKSFRFFKKKKKLDERKEKIRELDRLYFKNTEMDA